MSYTGNIPSDEYEALHELYTALDGQHWDWATAGDLHSIPWNFSENANPCLDHWQGLVCDYRTDPILHILEIDLSTYNLVGSIPASIDTFALLSSLQLSHNHITGRIPNSIGNLTNLIDLRFMENRLTGPIPESFGKLTNLQIFLLLDNQLTGTLPSVLQELTSLQNFGIGFNAFRGSIPSWIEKWSNLSTADFYVNDFTGTIPESVCSLQKLTFLEMQFNDLTGSIPDCISNMPSVHFVGLYNNKLTGHLPDAPGVKAPRLQYLELQNNFLSGTIPVSYSDFTSMQWLSLQNNSFAGTIPSQLGSLTQLQFLSLRINKLTGSIPTELNKLSKLTELLLEHNLLTGKIDNIINVAAQGSLKTIQLNDNLLTGTLPADIFTLPALVTFAAVSNCFSGPLPSSICNGTHLHSLILDGLTSAEACHNNLFPHTVSNSYSLIRSFGGSIPECLFTLPNITTLHLSGNEFTGTLPNTVFSPNLVDLSVSHNRLVGNIPLHVQSADWFSLDLSYNHFDGTLNGAWSSSAMFNTSIIYNRYETESIFLRLERLRSSNISARFNFTKVALHTELYLENNRLSGRIPSALQHRQVISILGSNVFSCHLDDSDLPAQDSGVDRYQCGSDNFNTPYYIWLGLAVFGCMVLCLVLYAHRVSYARAYLSYFSTEKAQLYWKLYNFHTYTQALYPNNNPLAQYSKVITLYEFILRLSLYSTCFILCALLPLYAIISAYYGTLTHQYAWAVSAAYISGVVPMTLLFLFLIVLVLIVVHLCLKRLSTTSAEILSTEQKQSLSSANADSSVADLYFMYAQNGLVYGVFILVNMFIVVGVNVAYVYVAIYRSKSLLVLSQVLLSLFKLLWNNVLSAMLLRYASNYLAKGSVGKDSTVSVETRFTTLLVFVALFNSVAIPCLVVAVVSPNCFYNVFVSAPAVSSAYAYEICAVLDRINGVCTLYLPVISETSYRPPFSYTYQCSSSLVTYYAPAYLTMCIMSGFVMPLFQYGMYRLHHYATPGTTLYAVLNAQMTRLLKPLREDSMSTVLTNYDPVRPLFKAARVLIIIFTYLTLILTFGAVFPPLAASLCVTLIIVTSVVRLRVGRFLSIAERLGLSELTHRIEQECQGVGGVSVVQNAMWMLITVSCLFYTLFLFDTLGDAVGFDRAYWVLIVVPLMPLCIYLSLFAYSRLVVPAVSVKSAPLTRASDVVSELHNNNSEVEMSIDANDVT